MTDLQFDADIDGPAEKIFDLIVNLGGQGRWLTHSSSFRGTTLLSPGPVGLGTRYRESDPFGMRNGTVTEFEPPAKVTFHQPMTLRLHAGTVDVTVAYTLTPAAGSTHVTRVVTLGNSPVAADRGSRCWSLPSARKACVPCSRSRRTPPSST